MEKGERHLALDEQRTLMEAWRTACPLLYEVYLDLEQRQVDTPPDFAEAIAKRRNELFVML